MKENLHVVMVPWSAFGHLLPFFHLSIALAKSQIHVSFISTPKNTLRLPKIPPNLSSFINLISFPLPKLDHNLLPEGAEATSDLPTEKVQYLKQATDLLRHPIKKFIADNSPDWIIVDFNAYWVSEISQVPIIMFWILSAVSLLYLYPPIITQPSPESMASPPEWVDFSTTVTYSSYEAKFMFSHLYEKRASGMGDSERFFTVIKYSKAVAYRSCEEIEDEYLSLCKKVIPSPGISIGLLPPEKPHMESNRDLPIFKWLDKQNVKSVVFVAFGSELNLTKDQIHEIANGLEISKVQFLWILRKPNWKNDDSNILPSGFCERTSERGFVSFEWAPQLEILAHPAIGGCLVHGGWGSIIESLQFGHCLIILPFVIDQPLNAKLLVEKGLALEIRRNEIDGSFCGKDIAGKLREAMLSDGGERVRRRVGEAAAIVGDKKLQEDYYVGVATAFAARDILGNVLSGLSMQFSQPFSLGDTIKAGTIEGQVVEMGLMTTSLLSAEKFPIIVPNSLFSSQVIVNKSRAQWRAITHKIPLQVDDLSRLSEISNDIKNMLKAHPKAFLEKETPYCFLSRIESTYAELTMGCNLIKMSTNELYSAKDDILLRSVNIIKEHGASLGSTTSDWTSH